MYLSVQFNDFVPIRQLDQTDHLAKTTGDVCLYQRTKFGVLRRRHGFVRKIPVSCLDRNRMFVAKQMNNFG